MSLKDDINDTLRVTASLIQIAEFDMSDDANMTPTQAKIKILQKIQRISFRLKRAEVRERPGPRPEDPEQFEFNLN